MARFKQEDENNWISISDIMTGLMVIFMLIAISYVLKVQEKEIILGWQKKELEEAKKQLEGIAVKLDVPLDSLGGKINNIVNVQQKTIDVIVRYKSEIDSLVTAIEGELGEDLKRWNATFDKKTLTIRFNNKTTKFGGREYELTNDFKKVLDKFYPKYLKIVTNDKYFDLIHELRIDGHAFDATSSTYNSEFNISQLRSRSVLFYLRENQYYKQLSNTKRKDLDFKIITSSMGSNRMIDVKGDFTHENNGVVCDYCSRRVEFTIVPTIEKVLEAIVNELENGI